nr:MAG TPA: hypothetical protein [Caudoviricetes sp.]
MGTNIFIIQFHRLIISLLNNSFSLREASSPYPTFSHKIFSFY